MARSKETSDLIDSKIKKLSAAMMTKTYVIEWRLNIGNTSLLKGTFRIRSKDGKAKVQRRLKRTIFNTLGVIGVSNIDTETFKATVTDA